jgi:predicted RNA binding protein YcfA (HicA-like mRNA interferase family)
MSKRAYSSHEIIKILKDTGFILDRVKGSHHIFIHPQNNKRAVVPHPKKDLPYGTASFILKQAGIET